MMPNPVEAKLKSLRRAQRFILVAGLLSPFLIIWTIELIALRGRADKTRFWILILSTGGIWAWLYFWGTNIFREFVRSKNSSKNVRQISRHQKFIFGIVGIILLGLAFIPSDGPFGAWPTVNTMVILRMLVLPIIGAVLLALVFKRFIEAFSIEWPRRRFVRNAAGQVEMALVYPPAKTTMSQSILLCVPLTMFWGAIGFASLIYVDLIKSQTLSLGHRKIYLHNSPEAFWTYIEIYILGTLMAVALCGWSLWEFVTEEKKRQSTRLSKAIILLVGLMYSGLLIVLCRLFYHAILLEN